MQIKSIATICGIHLKCISLGLESISINVLSLDLKCFNYDFLAPLADMVSQKLSRLRLESSKSMHYDFMEVFFSRCLSIKRLELVSYQFDEFDSKQPTPTVIKGVKRLTHLTLTNCEEPGRFVENNPHHNLESFTLHLNDSGAFSRLQEKRIFSAVSINYPNITTLYLSGAVSVTTATIIMISEHCRNLEKLTLFRKRDNYELVGSDIKAISSLPRLSYLDIGHCKLTNAAVSALALFKSLLYFQNNSRGDLLVDILAIIGKRLVSLGAWCGAGGSINRIAAHIPGIKHLDLTIDQSMDKDARKALELSISANFPALQTLRISKVPDSSQC
jgi:hypothetical protein